MRINKISLTLFISIFLINLFVPKIASASCGVSRGICPSSTVSCMVGSSPYCCDSPTECSTLQANPPSAPINNINLGGGSKPTDGCTNGINTAIGCIPVLNNDNGASFAGFILKWGIGVGSGIAFLLIVYASFMIMTSQGDPNRLKAGQELLTSAISGLILLIFSIFVLKFIGVDILGLDSWGLGK